MNKKLFSPAILILVFGMTVVGCPGPGEGDRWSDVTSLNQLNGTWKGSYSVKKQPIREFMQGQGQAWDNETMGTMLGDMKVSAKINITMKINAGAKTQESSTTTTATFSDGNIGIAWSLMKPFLIMMQGEGITVTTNDKTHSVTITSVEPVQPMSDEYIEGMLNSGLQINQNRKKLKVPENSLVQGMPEIIFTKQ